MITGAWLLVVGVFQESVKKPYCWCYNLGMAATLNHQVDAYINALPEWQQKICMTMRKLIHQAEPDIEETIKRGDRPYFVLNGNICALQATKDHVNVFIYDPVVPDPQHIINQGHGNATARSIQIYKDNNINEQAFKDLINAVADNNRAGGWRKLNSA